MHSYTHNTKRGKCLRRSTQVSYLLAFDDFQLTFYITFLLNHKNKRNQIKKTDHIAMILKVLLVYQFLIIKRFTIKLCVYLVQLFASFNFFKSFSTHKKYSKEKKKDEKKSKKRGKY
jgi:hypothetical protein